MDIEEQQYYDMLESLISFLAKKKRCDVKVLNDRAIGMYLENLCIVDDALKYVKSSEQKTLDDIFYNNMIAGLKKGYIANKDWLLENDIQNWEVEKGWNTLSEDRKNEFLNMYFDCTEEFKNDAAKRDYVLSVMENQGWEQIREVIDLYNDIKYMLELLEFKLVCELNDEKDEHAAKVLLKYGHSPAEVRHLLELDKGFDDKNGL